jgi:hypothetical protein
MIAETRGKWNSLTRNVLLGALRAFGARYEALEPCPPIALEDYVVGANG